jgi:hypothetical protein
MQWRLYIEEYSPKLCYIKGAKNVAADALSPLGILNSPMNKEHFTEALHSELYPFDDDDLSTMAFHQFINIHVPAYILSFMKLR